jgi:hypothetical protein
LVTISMASVGPAVEVDELLADVQRDAARERGVVLHVGDRRDVERGAGDPGGVDQRAHEALLAALDRDLEAGSVGRLGGEASVGTGDLDPGRTEGLGDELDRSVHVPSEMHGSRHGEVWSGARPGARGSADRARRPHHRAGSAVFARRRVAMTTGPRGRGVSPAVGGRGRAIHRRNARVVKLGVS